jgi:YggT family protein
MSTIITVVRLVVLAVFLIALFAATASWLVRTRRVSPFRPVGRFLRGASDPLMTPVEQRVVRAGRHPAQAPFWLLMVTAVGGILLLSLIDWTVAIASSLRLASTGGARGLLVFAIDLAYKILILALIVRVVASWFGRTRYTPWLRPAYALTDWVVEPLRRIVPPMGMIDVTPLVAWLALWAGKRLLIAIIVAL